MKRRAAAELRAAAMTDQAADELAKDVLALVVTVLNAVAPARQIQQETAWLASLDYERVVERPRKAGIDPVWRSLWAEATHRETA